jgi:OFA family oxalate/formate antiporter-like MFS transporter
VDDLPRVDDATSDAGGSGDAAAGRSDDGSRTATAALPVPQRAVRLASRHGQPRVRAVLAASVVNFSVGVVYTWSVFIGPLMETFDVARTTLSLGFSGMLVGFTIGVLVGGGLAQRTPGRLTRIAAGGSVAGMLVAAAAPSAAVLLGAVVAMGIAGGFGYAVATGVAAVALPQHRSLAVAFVVTGAAAGPMVLAPAASGLIAAVGWRGAFAVLGVASAAAILIAGRNIRPEVARGSDDEDDLGPPHDSPDRRLALGFLWGIFLAASLPCLIGFGHAAAVAAERGLPPGLGGFAVAAMSVGDIAGRVVTSGSTARRRTHHLVAAVASVLAAAAALAVTEDVALTMLALGVLGVGYGTHVSLVVAGTSDHVRRDGYSRAFGRVYTAWGLAAVSGPLGAATLRELTGSYRSAFAMGAAAAAVAVALAVSLHVLLARRRSRRSNAREM